MCKVLHQSFTDCISDQYTHFGMSTCQMSLQVMEGSLIHVHFFGTFHILHNYNTCLKSYKFIELLQIITEKKSIVENQL